jgi:hypothetical protein
MSNVVVSNIDYMNGVNKIKKLYNNIEMFLNSFNHSHHLNVTYNECGMYFKIFRKKQSRINARSERVIARYATPETPSPVEDKSKRVRIGGRINKTIKRYKTFMINNIVIYDYLLSNRGL